MHHCLPLNSSVTFCFCLFIIRILKNIKLKGIHSRILSLIFLFMPRSLSPVHTTKRWLQTSHCRTRNERTTNCRCRILMTSAWRFSRSSGNMAASVRLLVQRVRTTVTLTGRLRTSSDPTSLAVCRRFANAAAEKSTHFGFETVPEEEKAKKGNALLSSLCCP